MRLLWIINIPLPPLCDALGWQKPVIGGWLYSSLKQLKEKKDIELFVASPYSKGNVLIEREIEGVHYFALPYHYKSMAKTHKFVREYWKQINQKVKPDIVHIHGTEFAHGNDYIHACGADNVIISIQGLVSIIASFYLGGLTRKEIWRNVTLRDILRRSTIIGDQTDFIRRGEIEVDSLKFAGNVIGRTEWDHAHVWAINPDIKYFYCGETLRDSFYHHKWSYDHCKPHSIFVSQSGYPIKGLHKVLEALPLVIKHYPDTKVYVAGSDITNSKPWYRYTGYGKLIRRKIAELGLSRFVEFTGALSEELMCKKYLESNLFIISSCIENSPNSLGEAQVLGMPLLATYVGGIPDMMKGLESYLYRFEDVDILAKKICGIFAAKEDAALPEEIRVNACQRHSPEENLRLLLDIYRSIQGGKEDLSE